MVNKCRPREAVGALERAEEQLKVSKQALREAEQEAGRILAPMEGRPGTPEVCEFWRDEVKRLAMNKAYIEDVRVRLSPGVTTGADSTAAAQDPARLVLRLSIAAPDVEGEARFWVEAIGMQRYGDLAGGGAVVAFGPPGIWQGDEAAFFAIEIRQAPSPAAGPTTEPQGSQQEEKLQAARSTLVATGGDRAELRLSFVQVATPVQLRPSKVLATGGELLQDYGFYEVRSPAGVITRAYLDDRRDPVEFVAVAAPEGAGVAAAKRQMETLGLRPRGPYMQVSPVTQEYMPKLPPGNELYGSGDARKSVQVLILPLTEAPEDAPPESSSSYVLVKDDNSRYKLEETPEEERPYAPLSMVERARLVTFAPNDVVQGGPLGSAPPVGGARGSVMLEVRSAHGDAGPREGSAQVLARAQTQEWESHS